MDFITDIVKLLQLYAPQTNSSFLPEGKLRQIFEDTATGEVTTDRQAVRLLYGPDAHPQEKKFMMIKKELEDRIIERLLQHPPSLNKSVEGKQTWDTFPTAKLWCRRQMIFAEMLLTNHLHQHAEGVLLKVSKQADKLLFYHVLEETWLLLRQVYMLKGDAAKVAKYDEQSEALGRRKRRINQASGWYERLQLQANATIACSADLAEEAQRRAVVVNQWLEENPDPFLELYYYRICTIAYTNQTDTAALQTLIQAKATFIKKHRRFRTFAHWTEIMLNRIYLCQAKGNLRSARRYVERLLTIQRLPWNLLLAIKEKAFIVYLRLGEYDRAGEILQQVTRGESAALLNNFQAGQWYVREAYLYYALVQNQRAADVGQLTPRFAGKVSLAEFNRQTLPLASDKKGYQVQVLVMEILLMHQKGESNTGHYAKRLKMYYQRHLTALEDTKTKLFFQMMIKAATVDFDRDKTLKRTQQLVKELNAMPHHFPEQQELIPYKTLWYEITGMLIGSSALKRQN